MLEALLGGSGADEINELAEQARQMLLLVDNAIQQKNIPIPAENSMTNNHTANSVLDNLGKMDLTATVASAMKLYDDKERQKSALMKQQAKKKQMETTETELAPAQRLQQGRDENRLQPSNVIQHTMSNTQYHTKRQQKHKIRKLEAQIMMTLLIGFEEDSSTNFVNRLYPRYTFACCPAI